MDTPFLSNHHKISEYTIVKKLGAGGMGEVYLVKDQIGKHYAAKKMLIPIFSNTNEMQEAIKYFKRESAILTNLNHSGLPQIIEAFHDSSGYYIIMEFIEGKNLKQISDKKPINPEIVIDWAIQICEILIYLHQNKVIFRDIKKENVMLQPDGIIKLIDLGIAKIIQDTFSATKIGTPGYASPEQFLGRISYQSDIYTLGVLMAFLLTGKDIDSISIPFDYSELINQIKQTKPKLAAIIEKATEILPEKRYASAQEMKDELTKLIKNQINLSQLPTNYSYPRYEYIKILKGHAYGATSLLETHDKKYIISGSNSGTIKIWDKNTGACIRTIEAHNDSYVMFLLQTKDGRIVSASNDQTIKIWNWYTGKCLRTLEDHSGGITCLLQTNSGKIVSGSRNIKIWDLDTGTCVKILKYYNYYGNCLLESLDKKYIIAGDNDKTIKIWDQNSGRCVSTLKGHYGWISSLLQTHDGKIVSGSLGPYDKDIKIWDQNSGKCIKTLKGHTDSITCLLETHDGKIVSGSRDRAIKIWDQKTGACIMTLKGHDGWIRCLLETKNGDIVSGSAGTTINVWDQNSGKCIETLKGHTDSITCLLETHDEKIVSGSVDRTIIIWDKNNKIHTKKLQDLGDSTTWLL